MSLGGAIVGQRYQNKSRLSFGHVDKPSPRNFSIGKEISRHHTIRMAGFSVDWVILSLLRIMDWQKTHRK